MIKPSRLSVDAQQSFAWRTSSYSSGGSGQCVEVGIAEDRVAVRDSKNRDGGMLSMPPAAWTRFVRDVCDGARAADQV